MGMESWSFVEAHYSLLIGDSALAVPGSNRDDMFTHGEFDMPEPGNPVPNAAGKPIIRRLSMEGTGLFWSTDVTPAYLALVATGNVEQPVAIATNCPDNIGRAEGGVEFRRRISGAVVSFCTVPTRRVTAGDLEGVHHFRHVEQLPRLVTGISDSRILRLAHAVTVSTAEQETPNEATSVWDEGHPLHDVFAAAVDPIGSLFRRRRS